MRSPLLFCIAWFVVVGLEVVAEGWTKGVNVSVKGTEYEDSVAAGSMKFIGRCFLWALPVYAVWRLLEGL